MRTPFAMAAVSACFALILTGCGSGVMTPPNKDDSSSDSGIQDGEYHWHLPPTNASVDAGASGSEGPVYIMLQGSCDSAEQRIAQGYEGFQSPRNAVLYMAGVHLCRGDDDQARIYYDHVRSEYGLYGLGPEGSPKCELYKSVASRLEQAPRENFPCPGGAAPPHRHKPDGIVNPLVLGGAQNSRDSTTGDSVSGGKDGSTDEEEYKWELPKNDDSAQMGPAYELLRRGDCERAENLVRDSGSHRTNFYFPVNILLYMAGVHLCRGDQAQAQIYYDKARSEEYGVGGLGSEGRNQCELYKSVASTLEKKPRKEGPCPGGTTAQWRVCPSVDKYV